MIAYVRIADGELRQGQRILMMATNSSAEVLEVGYFSPQLISSGTLTVDSLKVAILAALHIADELHRLKNMHEQADSQLAARSAECAEMLDRLLKVRTSLESEQGGAGKLSLG